MPDLWMPGATRLDIGDHAPTDGGPAKAIPHITWDRNATAARPQDLVPYETLRDYFGSNPDGKRAAPHLLWDPFTGRVTQFVPASSRSKSLADQAGGTRTNRAGSVVIQIEAVFFPYCRVGGKVYAKLTDTPCKGWAEILAWIRSWGVPDAWPNGRPENCTRNATNWATKAGWFPHKAVPENDHDDPLSWPAFTINTPAPSKEDPVPTVITESSDTDSGLRASTWTTVAMAQDSALLQGPVSYSVAAYLRIGGAPGTRVKGRFYDQYADGHGSRDLAIDLGTVGPDGVLDAQVARPGQLADKVQLKLEVWADKPATITYRVLRSLRWTA
ncbi:endolysin [Streptomyces sp. NPDC048629]|uniref:endolysin n=1 Tax=Streptomyces sp. NPDC048629 TaxID=3154824 RepID=UPI00343368DE